MTTGASRPAAAAIQSHIVDRARSTPNRRKIPSWRYSGRWSAYLLTATWARSPGPGNPFSIGSGSRPAITTWAWHACARVLGPDVPEHDQRGRHVFELLADLLADARPLRAAVGAGPLLGRDVVHDLPAREARRQGLAAVALGSDGLAGGGAVRPRVRVRALGRGGFEDLAREEQELVGVEFLGLPAVEPAEELFELVLELFVEVGLLAERREQLADEPVGGLEVVGEWGVGVDRRHTISTPDDRRCD